MTEKVSPSQDSDESDSEAFSRSDFLRRVAIGGGAVLLGANTIPLNLVQAAEARDRKPINARDYTYGKFDEWKNNKVHPAAFNGVAVVDGSIQLSTYIDPDKTNKWPRALNEFGTSRDVIKKEFAVMVRPIFHIDSHGQPWIGVSDLSSPNNLSSQPYRDAHGEYRASNQVTIPFAWTWAPFDQRHVKLYEYTDRKEAPVGPQPFIGLLVSYTDPIRNNTPMINEGLVNNFFDYRWGLPPERIAAWGILDWIGKSNGRPVNAGGKYVGAARVKAYLSKLHIRSHQLPGSSREIKKLMEKYAGPQ